MDTIWTFEVNVHIIQCECGNKIRHRADRWKVKCKKCKRTENLGVIRDRLVSARWYDR